MTDLLDKVFEAHGGLRNWQSTQEVRFAGSAGGQLPWPRSNFMAQTGAVLSTHEQRVILKPFGRNDRQALFTPEYVEIRDAEGIALTARENPRRSFGTNPSGTLWNEAQAAFFAGYAFWTYLNVPFALANEDIHWEEIQPWHENGETWRRLRVTFPDRLVTHSTVQTFYFGDDFLLRRHDYSPDVLGNPLTAHYTTQYRTYDGFAFPTRRFVLRRAADNTSSGAPLIHLDINTLSVS
jgi:hypothetical protein